MTLLVESLQTHREDELEPRVLVSPGGLAAGYFPGLTATITPESSGVFLYDGLGLEVDLRASTGDQLPDVANQIAERDRLIKFGGALGDLAAGAEVSKVTGCWLAADGWRDDRGYTYVRDPSNYGVTRDSNFGIGIRGHKLAYILFKRETDPSFQLEPYTPLDHRCRNTACRNPYHLAPTTPDENNELARLAQAVEDPLIAGQTMLAPTNKDWIDGRIAFGEDSDYDETYVMVATRDGVYRLISSVTKGIAMIRGERVIDDSLECLRPMSPRKARQPSRARKPIVIKGQEAMFHPLRYRKLKPRKSKKNKKTKSKSTPIVDASQAVLI